MNENLLDVLLYLFENFSLSEAEHAANVRDELDEAGFYPDEIDDAFAWIRATAPNGQALDREPDDHSFRVYADAERRMLDSACRGYLVALQDCGVLSAAARELVIDRVMALAHNEFDGLTIEKLKWVVMLVLASSGEDMAYARMQAIVHDDTAQTSH